MPSKSPEKLSGPTCELGWMDEADASDLAAPRPGESAATAAARQKAARMIAESRKRRAASNGGKPHVGESATAVRMDDASGGVEVIHRHRPNSK